MRSWVRGQWIPFNADALSQFLGHPLILEEGQLCEYIWRRIQVSGFDEEAIAQLLCIPGQDFARTIVGRRVRIMRTSMTTLTQIWMTLLLSNIDAILPRTGPVTRAMSKRLQDDWAGDKREGPRVLISLRVDFGPMGSV